ncbi:hypothetical protein DUI87_00033 [Hirundo rustica rustica]|uniref:DUF5577 domain-containing protein n=1 Tax=Hirundo rustica rustica TaxID=333673 RepID=A0A3M0LD37_HIRRU|nr:hypothetical protein DUI87_00033 [Hirundo rustica rustica]
MGRGEPRPSGCGFFEDAGIPPGPALGYAVAFVDNRIHKNMLLDLTKELMKELGITVVGDVIAILRHAKVVHRQVRDPRDPLGPSWDPLGPLGSRSLESTWKTPPKIPISPGFPPQEMCRAASESLQPEAPAERGPRRDRDHRDPHRDHPRDPHRDHPRDHPRIPVGPPGG